MIDRRRKSGKLLPGPSFVVPVLGGVPQMVLNPYKFWEDQRRSSFPGAALLHHTELSLCDAGSPRDSLHLRSMVPCARVHHPSAAIQL